MEKSAAHSATSAMVVSPQKSTILLMVEATLALIWVMIRTPKKLQMALMIMADRTRMHRVVTQVAMALGASVQPLTKMTPSVRATVIAKTGFEVTCWRKDAREIPTTSALIEFRYKRELRYPLHDPDARSMFAGVVIFSAIDDLVKRFKRFGKEKDEVGR